MLVSSVPLVADMPRIEYLAKNASIAETKAALAAAGQVTDYMPIPLTVQVLNFGDHYVMIDAGSGAPVG